MASISFIIGIIGNIISFFVFTCPIKTFWEVVKNKSTEDYEVFPYIITLLGTSLWTFYGCLKPGGLLVVTVNGIGATFQFIYVTLFLIYAPKNKKVRAAKLVALLNVGFLGVVIAVTLLALHAKLRLTFVGLICVGMTTIVYGSPLSAMVPSVLGVLLGIIQLILYAMYKKKPMSTKSTNEMQEKGSDNAIKEDLEMQVCNNNGDDCQCNRKENGQYAIKDSEKQFL
ncbi:bidirectional sugar transporter SWEET16 isoform X2 [Hevea brasiliensis]|uniref:bidirectional sugar transporter SWEET16 isoform X2 n=1 Tax=Hevea brasiliensis TaxID=3981 RepID=UPI0025E6647A|nr:bidirectional sugar transporter SWEET16 isoform X2 [Hevea brasiliensis]